MKTQVLRPLILTGPLCIAHEKALFRRQTVARLQLSAGRLRPPGHVRKDQTSQVCYILAEGQAAIDVNVVDHDILSVLFDDALSPLLELMRIGVRPPVLEVTG